MKRLELKTAQRQQGAALIVGLVMMVVLTLLAVSSMNTATLELTMARNNQEQENAFQAAETAVDIAIARKNWTTAVPTALLPTSMGGYGVGQATTTCVDMTNVPDRAFSMGEGQQGIKAYHFDTIAQGTAANNAISFNNQSFYIVGPGSDGCS